MLANPMFYILLLIIAPLGNFLHEAGHAAGAAAAQADKISITIGGGPKLLTFTIGKLTIQVNIILFAGGHHRSWRADSYSLREQRLIAAGGPFMNIAAGAAVLLLYNICPDGFLRLFCMYNAWLGLVNLLPFRLKGKASDGWTIWQSSQKHM